MESSDQLIWYVVPAVIALGVLIMAIFLESGARKNRAIKKLGEVLKSGAFLSPTVLSIAIGFVFIISGTKGFLFTPAMALDDSTFHLVLKYGQIVIGIGMVVGVFKRLMTLGIVALFVAAFFTFPALKILDYSVFVGIGVYLFLVHRDALSFSFFFHPIGKHELFDSYRKYALPILRVLAGLGLAYAAYHHYILDSQSAIAFVDEKPLLNFMQSTFGVQSFTNEILVFQTGVVGILAGLMLALGLLERLTASLIGIGLLVTLFIIGPTFLPVSIPYFALIYIVITGNQFEEREKIEKG